MFTTRTFGVDVRLADDWHIRCLMLSYVNVVKTDLVITTVRATAAGHRSCGAQELAQMCAIVCFSSCCSSLQQCLHVSFVVDVSSLDSSHSASREQRAADVERKGGSGQDLRSL